MSRIDRSFLLLDPETQDVLIEKYAGRVRAMWLAGASVSGIATAMPLDSVVVASCLVRASDADLVAGLRVQLRTLTGE